MLRRPQQRVRYAPLHILPNPRQVQAGSPNRFSPRGPKPKTEPTWAYGVTTYRPSEKQRKQGAPFRFETSLPRTLRSLAAAGFESPLLFVDGETDAGAWEDAFGLEVVLRRRRIGAFGNWILGLAELMIRQPRATYYAMFQDDFVTSRNLRRYLETVRYPERGYLNLYTFPQNQVLSFGRVGFYEADQKGKGAVALVFDRETAVDLVSEPHMANRPRDPARGHKFIDGGVVESMKKRGYKEYCHNPSLVQHIGLKSTLDNPRHPRAGSFKGEEFDLLALLEPEPAA